MKQRNIQPVHFLWADVLRVIAITLVVFLHVFPSFKTVSIFTVSLYAIAKTCVPLFLMLTGALLLRKDDKPPVFVTKRLKRILVPWLFWALIFLVAMHANAMGSFGSIFQTYQQVFIAEFTYLPMIFSLYLLLPFFKLLLGKERSNLAMYYLLLWFLSICILPYTQDSLAFPLVVDNGLVRQVVQYSGYILLGYGLSNIRLKQSAMQMSFLIAAVSLFATYLLSTHGGVLGIVSTAYISPTIVILSASLFIFIKSLSERQMDMRLSDNTRIRTLSVASFGVFLCHPLIIRLLQAVGTQRTFLYIPLSILLSFAVVIFLQRLPGLKRLVG